METIFLNLYQKFNQAPRDTVFSRKLPKLMITSLE